MCESFIAWYSADRFERYTYLFARPMGPYAWLYWAMTIANVVTPNLFWFSKLRTNTVVLFIASVLIWLGMWAERFIIIVTSLNRDFLPSSWHFYAPTWVDWGLILGSLGVFFVLYFAFLRWVPAVPLAEVKALRFEVRKQEEAEV
jgi:molybdopterin-containing oxidoreductase family membrane subunit